jgi:hypothetical protein
MRLRNFRDGIENNARPNPVHVVKAAWAGLLFAANSGRYLTKYPDHVKR